MPIGCPAVAPGLTSRFRPFPRLGSRATDSGVRRGAAVSLARPLRPTAWLWPNRRESDRFASENQRTLCTSIKSESFDAWTRLGGDGRYEGSIRLKPTDDRPRARVTRGRTAVRGELPLGRSSRPAGAPDPRRSLVRSRVLHTLPDSPTLEEPRAQDLIGKAARVGRWPRRKVRSWLSTCSGGRRGRGRPNLTGVPCRSPSRGSDRDRCPQASLPPTWGRTGGGVDE